jgi:hypothetical protein
MNFTARDYQSEINTNTTWRKYAGPDNLKRITAFLQEVQWIPSQVTVERAITHLQLPRTDGGSARKDVSEIRRQAQANYDAAAAEAEALPLTPNELREFAGLSFADLQHRYWSEDGDFFRVRYNKAAKTFGYRIPEKPTSSAEVADDGTVRLTAAEYRKMSAQEVRDRMRSPRWKLALMMLIKNGEV